LIAILRDISWMLVGVPMESRSGPTVEDFWNSVVRLIVETEDTTKNSMFVLVVRSALGPSGRRVKGTK
jgi:hypothetical protein